MQKSYETKQYKKGLKAADAILKKFSEHGGMLIIGIWESFIFATCSFCRGMLDAYSFCNSTLKDVLDTLQYVLVYLIQKTSVSLWELYKVCGGILF